MQICELHDIKVECEDALLINLISHVLNCLLNSNPSACKLPADEMQHVDLGNIIADLAEIWEYNENR